MTRPGEPSVAVSWLTATLYDPVLRHVERAGLAQWRREALAHVSGRVLEVGAGTGLNLPHYPPAVTELVLVEPDPRMREQLRRRVDRAPDARITIRDADAGALPLADGSVDAVVATLVLCTVPEPDRALAEVRRVLAPDGVFCFVEHVGGTPGSRRRRWQRRLEPGWQRLAGGCRLTRDSVEAIEHAGFTITWLERSELPGVMRLGSPVVRGLARLA